MFKKTVKYTDYNGNPQSKDLYFNINVSEGLELLKRYPGIKKDYKKYIDSLVKNNDSAKMIEFIKDMMVTAYGVKSDDGQRFVKNAEIRNKFVESIAFAEMFEDIITNEKLASDFGQNVISKHTMDRINSQKKTDNHKVALKKESDNKDDMAKYLELKKKLGK